MFPTRDSLFCSGAHPKGTRRAVCFLVLGLLWIAGGIASAETGPRPVRMEGAAPGTGSQAFSLAIENAAVGVLADVLETSIGTTDFRPFEPILDRAGDYIRSYRVVRHRDEGDLVLVEIEAYIFEERLRQDLARLALAHVQIPPRTVVLMVESVDDSYRLDSRGVASRQISEALTEKWHEILDVESLKRVQNDERLVSAVAAGPQQAARLAREHLADAIVIGELAYSGNASASDSNILRNAVQAEFKVIRATDGKVLETVTAEAVVHSLEREMGIEQATRDVCSKVKDSLILAVALSTFGPAAAQQVIVEIPEVGDLGRIERVAGHLAELWGVEEAEVLVSSENLSRIRVCYDGPMGPLVDQIAAARFDDFGIAVRRVVEREVELTITESGG